MFLPQDLLKDRYVCWLLALNFSLRPSSIQSQCDYEKPPEMRMLSTVGVIVKRGEESMEQITNLIYKW